MNLELARERQGDVPPWSTSPRSKVGPMSRSTRGAERLDLVLHIGATTLDKVEIMERDTLSDATLHLLLSTPNPAPAARELEITRNAIRETLVLLDALREHEAELVAELAGVRD